MIYSLIIFSGLVLLSCDTSKSPTQKQQTQTTSTLPKSLFELDSMRVGLLDDFMNCHLLDTIPISYEVFSGLNEESIAPSDISRKNGVIELPLNQNETVLIKNYANTTFDYLGYLKKINCYALAENSVDEGIDFSELILINKDNKCRYAISSIGDWRVSDPIVSENGRFLAYYFNANYEETASYLMIMSVNTQNSKERYLIEHAFLNAENFAIRSIRWINNREIAICAYHDKIGLTYYKMQL